MCATKSSLRSASLAILWAAALHGVPVFAADGGATPGVATPNGSPLGLWKTFDDKTGSARAIVHVYEENGKLFGRIEHSFTPGSEKRVCELCTDERKNQPIIGLLIIRGMKASDGE